MSVGISEGLSLAKRAHTGDRACHPVGFKKPL